MKGDQTTIKHLNTILKNELTAINQFFLHSRLYENWGLTKMAKHEYAESIEEMQHADMIIKRILFLEGLPALQDLNKLMIGETVPEAIECDLKLEYQARDDLKKAIQHTETVQDYVTREMFLTILKDEETHIDHLETQLESIKLQGLQNFIQLHSDPAGAA